jgi:hypothetical protein
MAPANEVLQFVIVSPADGTNAAVNWRDYGRSRWQLSDDGTLLVLTSRCRRMAHHGPSRLPHRANSGAIG